MAGEEPSPASAAAPTGSVNLAGLLSALALGLASVGMVVARFVRGSGSPKQLVECLRSGAGGGG